MKTHNIQVALLLGAVLAAVGCSDSDDDGTATVTVSLRVIQFEPGGADTGIPDVEVCVSDLPDCDTTDEDGFVTLEVPANEELAFEAVGEGFVSTLQPQTTTDQNLSGIVIPMLTVDLFAAFSLVVGVPYPPDGVGVVGISALVAPTSDPDNGIAGITFTTDTNGIPYYLDENEVPSLTLTETTVPSGAGGLLEVAPGEVEVELGGTASNCVLASAWPGANASSIRFPIEAGFLTQVFVTCDP